MHSGALERAGSPRKRTLSRGVSEDESLRNIIKETESSTRRLTHSDSRGGTLKRRSGSQETHVIHTFKEDFYGQILSVVLVGYIRPERSYDSLDALIAAINHDIEEAKRKLDLPEHLKLKKDNFFIASASSSMTSSNKITKGH